METEAYIKKQFKEHNLYVNSLESKTQQTIWGKKYHHPKTGKSITFNAKCALIDNDIKKRVKRIQKLYDARLHQNICSGVSEMNKDFNRKASEHLEKLHGK